MTVNLPLADKLRRDSLKSFGRHNHLPFSGSHFFRPTRDLSHGQSPASSHRPSHGPSYDPTYRVPYMGSNASSCRPSHGSVHNPPVSWTSGSPQYSPCSSRDSYSSYDSSRSHETDYRRRNDWVPRRRTGGRYPPFPEDFEGLGRGSGKRHSFPPVALRPRFSFASR